MPVPQCPEKVSAESLLTPESYALDNRLDSTLSHVEIPEGILLTYHDDVLDRVQGKYQSTIHSLRNGTLVTFDDLDASVGLVGGFGVGGPATAIILEELIAAGATHFLLVGFAGCLQPDTPASRFVACTEAIRDEGTSYHYLPPNTAAEPAERLVDLTVETVHAIDYEVVRGPSWTTSAFYRETPLEIEHYRSRDVMTVELEAAAAFAVAAHRDVETGALFVISDYFSETEWVPERGASFQQLMQAVAVGRHVLRRAT